MHSNKSVLAQGIHLETRVAFIRTDYSVDAHRASLDFSNDEPVLFQSPTGELDQFAQASLVVFGFEEPFDGTALTVNASPELSRLHVDLDSNGLTSQIEKLLARSFVTDERVASAIATVIAGYWGFDGDFGDFKEDVLQGLDDEQFEFGAEDAADTLVMDDGRCAGGILLELTLSHGLTVTVRPDGTLEIPDDIDWDDYRRERCICWIKPAFAYGLSPAES